MIPAAQFAFGAHPLRAFDLDGALWFAAIDVARALGIKNSRKMTAILEPEDRGVTNSYTPGGCQDIAVISEAGLYIVMLRSNAALQPGSLAYRFRRWVTGEVLPELRLRGRYAGPGAGLADCEDPEEAPDPETGDFLRACREVRLTWGVAAARRFWRDRDLEAVSVEALPLGVDPDILLFLHEDCVITGNAADAIEATALKAALTSWALRTGQIPRGDRAAGLALLRAARHYIGADPRLRFWRVKRSRLVYLGITLR